MEKFQNGVNFENLMYYLKGLTKDIDFNYFIDAETLFNDIKSKRITFEYVEKKSNGIYLNM